MQGWGGMRIKTTSLPIDQRKRELEVDAADELNQSSARIVGCRSVPIGVERSTKFGRGKAADGGNVTARVANEEVNVVERVQELGAKLEVDLLRDPDPLDRAQIEPGEFRPVENEMVGAALRRELLDATAAVRRRDVTACWRATAAVTVRRGRAHVGCPDRVFNDVLRQEVSRRSLSAIRQHRGAG